MSKFRSLYDIITRFAKVLTRRSWPLHRFEAIEPFFIIGAGRSGTTLLRRILVASKQIHIPPETYVLPQIIEHYRRNAYLDWPTLVKQCMSLFELHPEFDTFQITLRPLLAKLYALPETERSLAKMLDMFYCYHAEQTGVNCERWGDKTPINTFALDDIYAVFPQAQFIHLLRDGVDVVHSYMSTGLISSVDIAAKRWVDSVKLACAFSVKHTDTCMEMRYEKLSCHTDTEIKRACSFLDIDYVPDMINQREHISGMGDMQKYKHYQHANETITSKYVGKGRKALSKEDQLHIKSAIGCTLQEMGYGNAEG